MNPVADASLETRADARRVVRRLVERVEPRHSPGKARVRLGATGAVYPETAAELEAFSRPLWGLAPLAAGGGSFDGWERYRTGLRNGCDPDHDEYWGPAGDGSQKHVEMAAIGVALALAPGDLWDPLDAGGRTLVADWLGQTNDAALWDGNWLFFRVLTNLGLRAVGDDHDPDRVQSDLDRLESFALADGWYADGGGDPPGARDYYVAWEFHVDGLLYAALAGEDDPDRAARFRERARQFAGAYVHWFADDGRALPYGRSLTYRFAQAAFWGALALADAKPPDLSWGEVRGLWARNVRWWLRQPVFTDGGLLSVGYRYPTLKVAEPYNGPGGPYWALKAALPLALPADHPFWAADEAPLPDLPAVTAQDAPNLLVCRDEGTDHHFCLAAGQRHVAGHSTSKREKYNKFAYSTAFGVGVASRQLGLLGAGHDSALALSEDGRHFRTREGVTDPSVTDGAAYSRWEPFEDVAVETWLVPALPWHVRVHRLEAGRRLQSAEGGFALDRTGDDDPDRHEHRTDDGWAVARYPGGTSAIVDPGGGREGSVVGQDPNVNLHHQRTVVPTLTGTHDPGESWLTAAAVAAPDPDADLPVGRPPDVTMEGEGFTVVHGGGVVYEGP